MRTLVPWLVVGALFGVHAVLPPPSAACPRCNREGFRRSLLEGRFVHFHPITRTLRVHVEGPEGTYEERIVVPPNVRPRRGDTVLRWRDIPRGASVEVEITESEMDRQVSALRLTDSAD